MRRVLFVVGPALGHVGRSLVIARALDEIPGYRIQFAGVSPGHAGRIVGAEFPVSEIRYDMPGDLRFAVGLERVFEAFQPELICLDLSPIPWLTSVRLPRVTQAYITNFFLTRPFGHRTFQDDWFERGSNALNAQRRLRGLPSITAVKSFYDRDAVILADPPALIEPGAKLPGSYHVVGPCSWEPDSTLPEEIAELRDYLFVSLGSTSRAFPDGYIDRVLLAIGATTAVWTGKKPPGDESEFSELRHFECPWVPATKLLARSRFVITHGGAGSTYQAIAAGLPVAVWPGHQNHRVLGEILKDIGAGLVLDDKFDPQNLSSDVLDSLQKVSSRCSIGCDDGPRRAARILSSL